MPPSARESCDDADQQRVFAARQKRQKPGVDREEGGHSTADFESPAIGREDSGEDT